MILEKKVHTCSKRHSKALSKTVRIRVGTSNIIVKPVWLMVYLNPESAIRRKRKTP